MGKAARAIHELINSRSAIPTVTEIERVLQAQAAPAPSGGVTISAITQAICEAHDLHSRADDGEGACRRIAAEMVKDIDPDKRLQSSVSKQWIDTLHLESAFDEAATTSVARINGLHSAMMHLEPATPSEVLSLAIMTREALEHFVGDHITRALEAKVEREAEIIDRALDAIIRGLVHVMSVDSPLVKRYVVGGRLTPRHEEHARLLEQLPRVMAERAALDPSSGGDA